MSGNFRHNFAKRDYLMATQTCRLCGYTITDETLLQEGNQCQGFDYWLYREENRKLFRAPIPSEYDFSIP
jgi:hypothetical protein